MDNWYDPTILSTPYYNFDEKLCFESRDLLLNCLDKTSASSSYA